MSRMRCMFTANDVPPVRSRDAATPRGNHCALKTAGHTRSPGGLQARGAIPELPSDAVRSRATSNRRSDDSDAHAVGVQSMGARRGQRRTRTAEYDSFSVADDSARPDAELPVNRRSPLSCSKTSESRWSLFATRQPSSPVAQVDALPRGRTRATRRRRKARSPGAQFRIRPRDRTSNRSCDIAAAGACRCWSTSLPTIWSASGIRRAPPGTLRQSACGTAQAGSEPKLWLGPAALRRRLMTTARTGPRRAADLPQRRSALPPTSWREFGEFRDSCGTALSCDMTITPQSCPLPDSLRVPVLGPALGPRRHV